MNYWFISDTHFGHENIIKYCSRPFTSVDEMDELLINNWNDRVKEEDIVFFLGDFCFNKSTEAEKSKGFHYYRHKLKGNIIFLNGNHDTNKRNGFKTIIDSIVIHHGGYSIHLAHQPNKARKEYKINFCGHEHGKYGKFIKLTNESTIIDLSVENWKYKPVSITEIIPEFEAWKKEQK